MGFVSLPHPAPNAPENPIFDNFVRNPAVRGEMYDLYGKYDLYDRS
jgi:hypothetical protein